MKWILNLRGCIDRENLSSILLLKWTSFIGQFVHPLRGEGEVVKRVDEGIIILASCEYNFISERVNMVQHPINSISVASLEFYLIPLNQKRQ